MLKYVLVAFLVSSLMGSAHAIAYTEASHIGALCTACHDKFAYRQPYAENLSSLVRNPEVIDMFPCYKRPCHFSSNTDWGGGGNRYGRHMGTSTCKNCHGESGKFDIHKSHTKNESTLDCNYCHASPMGWNSSRVTIPAYEDLYIADSTLLNTSIRKPGWANDCGYCHVGAANATRQHEVHEQVIEAACVECHGEIIESVPNPLKKAVVEGDEPPPEVRMSLAQRVMLEYSGLFSRISVEFLDFYNFMKE